MNENESGRHRCVKHCCLSYGTDAFVRLPPRVRPRSVRVEKLSRGPKSAGQVIRWTCSVASTAEVGHVGGSGPASVELALGGGQIDGFCFGQFDGQLGCLHQQRTELVRLAGQQTVHVDEAVGKQQQNQTEAQRRQEDEEDEASPREDGRVGEAVCQGGAEQTTHQLSSTLQRRSEGSGGEWGGVEGN
ncbi:unnamed protein product [Protopolystoma xenopodis]|uniref:Uncharacterized protein n=1 Tax=Protopolystoma xenopodis TaxID=117903 RepID=A0A3S5AIH0_9PLAT|nr:unnamed protein product [Protopolystoma xenopodis]